MSLRSSFSAWGAPDGSAAYSKGRSRGAQSRPPVLKSAMTELRVAVGRIELKNPVIAGSGEYSMTPGGIRAALAAGAAAVVAKSTNESAAAKAQLDGTDYALL